MQLTDPNFLIYSRLPLILRKEIMTGPLLSLMLDPYKAKTSYDYSLTPANMKSRFPSAFLINNYALQSSYWQACVLPFLATLCFNWHSSLILPVWSWDLWLADEKTIIAKLKSWTINYCSLYLLGLGKRQKALNKLWCIQPKITFYKQYCHTLRKLGFAVCRSSELFSVTFSVYAMYAEAISI